MTLTDVRNQLNARINRLENIAKRAELTIHNYDILKRIMHKSVFDIAVVGEFDSGKSTLINALLGIDLLPSSLEPTTAKVTYISYSEEPRIIISMKDGTREIKDYDESYLKGLIAENKSLIEKIDYIEVFLNNDLLKDGVRIIDTPGTNDTDEQRVAVTYGILPEADAVIYLTIHPVTASNMQVFREQILNNKIKNIFFVFNKIDMIKDDVTVAVKDAKSWFLKEYSESITHFYPVSALDYLDGILIGNSELITGSKFKIFLSNINQFLTSSDKYVKLREQYTLLFEDVKDEAEEMIKIKIAGFSIPEAEFQERKSKIMEELLSYKEQVIELEKQIEREFDILSIKIEDSLNNLLDDILGMLEELISRNGDMTLLLKELEIAIKNRYEMWRERNEPLIEEILTSITEEISIRTMSSYQGVNSALIKFAANKPDLRVREERPSAVAEILKDPWKTKFASMAAVVGGMALLSVGSLFMPVAFLIGPIVERYREKWMDQQREKAKPQIVSAIQENFLLFRQLILENINSQKETFSRHISEGIIQQNENLRQQIDNIDKERNSMKISHEDRIRELESVLYEIEAIE